MVLEPPSGSTLPARAYLVALASLGRMGPRRLRALLVERTAAEAWTLVRDRPGGPVAPLAAELGADATAVWERWRREARGRSVAELWHAHVAAGVAVSGAGEGELATVFADDPDPPPVLFHRGDVAALAAARVGIVGTRRCTQYGRELAFELGSGLAAAGVAVVSGLAIGIDAAAHAGALDVGPAGASPIAVVGSGLDVRYPAVNAELWRAVERHGVVLSEYPLGRRPQSWQFPARNRLIASLADVLVVVESGERGGSMYTVTEALARDRPVMSVPGSVRSPVSAGTNRLLADGALVVRSVDDVLLQLGLAIGGLPRRSERREVPTGDAATVLDVLGWEPASLEQLVLRLGWPLAALSAAVTELEEGGWVVRSGSWLERTGC